MSESTRIHLNLPDGEHTIVTESRDRDRVLSDILRSHEVALNTRCMGQGRCEGCRVTVVEGSVRRAGVSESDDAGGVATAGPETSIKSCQYRLNVTGDVRLAVPRRSLVAHTPQVLDAFSLNVPLSDQPITTARYAVAIDIGTTTVAVALVDMARRDIVARASAFNRQIHMGDNVLTRINLCLTEPSYVKLLRSAIVKQTILPLIEQVRAQVEAAADESIESIVIAGNTTMLHLALGEDPGPMGIAPFTPVFVEHRQIEAKTFFGDDLPTTIGAKASVHLLPSAAAYVGADIVGGCLVSGMRYRTDTTLLVDVGTNGEIVLHHDGRLLGCATAAGPAFEGQGLTSGMRATRGAICDVTLDPARGDVCYETIGNARPDGICGSAYIDLLAEGRRHRLLDARGRFTEYCAQVFGDRLRIADEANELGRALHLVEAKAGQEAIVINEYDIATLVQARAAIAAGIGTLLAKAQIATSQVDTLFIAGGFGMHLDITNAIDCGLLPGFDPSQVERVGNASLGAAYATILDRSLLDELSRISTEIDVLELNLEPAFQELFVDHLSC